MKVTFMEEIEVRKAWREPMCCPVCGDFKYNVHHQLKPETSECWWIECPNCGHESQPAPARDIAIARWKVR